MLDGGWNAHYQIHVGTRKLFNELTRINIHRIEKAPLALGEKDIECQRAFAEPLTPVIDDKTIARNFERKIFEIMFARAVDGDGVVRLLAGVHGNTFARKLSHKHASGNKIDLRL